MLKVASRWMIGLIAMPMLMSCAAMGPQALCPDIGGIYADRAQGDKGLLVSVLTGQKTAPADTVELTVEQARYGKSAGDYQATLSFLVNRVSGIRKALRGE